MSWDRAKALREGKAKTRDGRHVVDLREAVLDGKAVLGGRITASKPPWKRGRIIPVESAYWEAGGLGLHGGDDLINC